MPPREESPSPAQVEARALALVERLRTLTLATVDTNGVPLASYAPFVRTGDAFCVYVSALAAHTANLIDHRRAGVMLIEDEAESRQPFARTRLVLDCTVEEVARESASHAAVLDGFAERFGEVMELIRPLPDFRLLRLVATRGTCVLGFGRAYAFEGPRLGPFSRIGEAAIRRRAERPGDGGTRQR